MFPLIVRIRRYRHAYYTQLKVKKRIISLTKLWLQNVEHHLLRDTNTKLFVDMNHIRTHEPRYIPQMHSDTQYQRANSFHIHSYQHHLVTNEWKSALLMSTQVALLKHENLTAPNLKICNSENKNSHEIIKWKSTNYGAIEANPSPTLII